MIYLTKGQVLKDNPGMVVFDPTGYYNDSDSVICASIGFPEEPVCRYEAKFIAYGGMVYSISNPDELMEQIIKLDPDSLYGKDSQNVAVDKMVEEIIPQEPGGVVEEATTEEVKPSVIENDMVPQAEPIIEKGNTNEGVESVQTTTPVTPEITPVDTTSAVSSDETVTDETVTTSTTTNILPEIEQAVETMTSTDSGLEST